MIRNRAMDSRTSDRWSNEMIEKFVREKNMMLLAFHESGSKRDVFPAMYDAMSAGRRLGMEMKDVIETRFKYREPRYRSQHSRRAYLSKPFVLPLDLEEKSAEGDME